MKTKWIGAALGVGLAAVIWGCSSDETPKTPAAPEGDHKSAFVSCQAIIDACHPFDVGEGAAHDCHEVAHDDGATEEKCAARKTECLATCEAAGKDGGTEAGAEDH